MQLISLAEHDRVITALIAENQRLRQERVRIVAELDRWLRSDPHGDLMQLRRFVLDLCREEAL